MWMTPDDILIRIWSGHHPPKNIGYNIDLYDTFKLQQPNIVNC